MSKSSLARDYQVHNMKHNDITTSNSQMNTRQNRIRHIMEEKFHPAHVEIIDQSERHKHHKEQLRGPQSRGETHFMLKIISPSFEGMRRIDRSRKVHALLAQEFDGGLHALSLSLLTPQEEDRG